MITAGEVLKRKRITLEKDLDRVSSDTKIQRRFLEYIEDNQFERFDSDVFASGFIKIYSKYLGLDVEKILALYRRSRPKPVVKKSTKSSKKKKFNIDISPKLISIAILAAFLIGIVGYIGYQIYKFQTPPQLEISQPQNDTRVVDSIVQVRGITDTTANVEINGEPVQTDEAGWFEKEIELNPGVNTITVKARKNSNSILESSESIRITYEVEEQQPEETTEDTVPQEKKIKLQITGSSAWVKLDIDGVNKVSQILEPSTVQEFTVVKNFSLITGRVQSTKLFYNEEEISLGSTQGTGVVQIDCQISQEEILCE